MPITLVGQAGTGGGSGTPFPTPGPTISYNSVTGNTLVVTGQFEATQAITGITSVSDSAGNTWQFSTTNNQDPPSVTTSAAGTYFCSFVGWCVGASAVTSVSLTGNVGNTSGWLVSLSEWNSVSSPDTGVALTGTNANPQATTTLTFPGDLIVGCLDSSSKVPSALPSGWTGFRDVGSPRVFAGYTVTNASGFYTAQWRMVSDTYTIAVMSFYSTGVVMPPPTSMRAF